MLFATGGILLAATFVFVLNKDLPLILENKGISLPDIERMTKKTNDEIDKLNIEIDNLVKD